MQHSLQPRVLDLCECLKLSLPEVATEMDSSFFMVEDLCRVQPSHSVQITLFLMFLSEDGTCPQRCIPPQVCAVSREAHTRVRPRKRGAWAWFRLHTPSSERFPNHGSERDV